MQSVGERPLDGARPESSNGVLTAAAGGLLLAAIIAGIVFWLLGLTQTNDLNPWNDPKPPDLYEMARSTAGITVALGAAIGLVLALRKRISRFLGGGPLLNRCSSANRMMVNRLDSLCAKPGSRHKVS
jgi:hypothetical protein